MLLHIRTLVTAVALVCLCLSTSSAQTGQGRIRGRVADGSGGVLPGVAVVATSADARVVATTATDGAGDYVFEKLPAGALTLTFQIEGFEVASTQVVIQPGAASVVPLQRLSLASIAESVVVTARAPVDVLPLPVIPPTPLPVVVPVAEHDHESVCGPAKPAAESVSFGTIRSRRYGAARRLYAVGDELIIEGGTLNGIEAGRNFVVRRRFRVGAPGSPDLMGEHTSGVVQIVSADERFSIGVVVYACDELMIGDVLAPFAPEPIRAPDPVGPAAYDEAARILFADAGQTMGMARRLMVIDRGSDQTVHAGQRLTLFHRERRGASPVVVGDAVVVAVRADSATIRIEHATDVIVSGDWAAPQRSPVAGPRVASTASLP